MRQFALLFMIAFTIGCSTDSIVAPATGSIRGIVKDSRNRKPLANASVTIVSRTESVVTDANGFYEMSDVAAGDYAVKALLRESNYVCYAEAPVRVDDGKTTTADMMLFPGSSADKGAIIGRVIDEQGNAVKGAYVSTDRKTATEITSDDGSFVIMDVPSDTVTVDVAGSDCYGRKRLFVKVGDTTTMTITAVPQDPSKGWLYGSVTSKGEPVPGAIIYVKGLDLADTTDELGTYRISNIPEGQVHVSYSRDGFRTRNFTHASRVNVGTLKDVALSEQTALPTENLELYLPFDGSIEDRSSKHRTMEIKGVGYKYVQDRFKRLDQGIQLDGTTFVFPVESNGIGITSITVGMWFFVEEYPTTMNYLLGKYSTASGDGFYITMKNRDISFAFVTDGGKNVSRQDFEYGNFEKGGWHLLGFSVAEDGTGYVTISAQTTFSIKPITGTSTNREPFTVGDVPAATGSNGFVGKLDQVVVYSRFMKLEELVKIMTTKD